MPTTSIANLSQELRSLRCIARTSGMDVGRDEDMGQPDRSNAGDAAYCVSLLAGQGSALAMTGAYILAGELAAPAIRTISVALTREESEHM